MTVIGRAFRRGKPHDPSIIDEGMSFDAGFVLKGVRVTLTHAQILTLPESGSTLIAAPGAGKLIVPIWCFGDLAMQPSAVYTGVTDASWVLYQNTLYASSLVKMELYLANAAPVAHALFSIPCPYMEPGADTFEGAIAQIGQLTTDAINQPVLLKDDWAGLTNYGGGHADNTLTLSLCYAEVTL